MQFCELFCTFDCPKVPKGTKGGTPLEAPVLRLQTARKFASALPRKLRELAFDLRTGHVILSTSQIHSAVLFSSVLHVACKVYFERVICDADKRKKIVSLKNE